MATSTNTAPRAKPPVVQPGVGKNIIVNPNQVGSRMTRSDESGLLVSIGALEPSSRMHPKRGQGIWRHCPRFPGWSYDVHTISQVCVFFTAVFAFRPIRQFEVPSTPS